MATLGELVVTLLANVAPFRSGMRSAEEIARGSAQNIARTLSSLQRTVMQLAGAVGFGLLLQRLDDLAKSSRRLGIAAEELQRLQHAASLSGIATEQLVSGLEQAVRVITRLSLGDRSSGSGQIVALLNEIGLSIDDLRGKRADELLRIIADAAARVSNTELTLTIAARIFGAEEFAELLSQGANGINRLASELDALGGVIDQDTISRVEEFNDNLERLKVSLTPVLAALVSGLSELAPIVKEMARNFGELGSSLRGVLPEGTNIQTAFFGAQTFFHDLGAGIGALVGGADLIESDKVVRQMRTEFLRERGLLPKIVEPDIKGVLERREKAKQEDEFRRMASQLQPVFERVPGLLRDVGQWWSTNVVEKLRAERERQERDFEERVLTLNTILEQNALLRDPSLLSEIPRDVIDTSVKLRGSREAIIATQQQQERETITLMKEQVMLLRQMLDAMIMGPFPVLGD